VGWDSFSPEQEANKSARRPQAAIR